MMAKFWTSQELATVLTKSSPHVRYLLWELFVKKEVPKDKLESKPVALAIVQRLCRSKGKDSLVTSGTNGDGPHYKLNPDYLEDFQNLLSKDLAPEKPKPRPKEDKIKKGPLVSTRSDGKDSAQDALPKKASGKETKSKKVGSNEMALPLTEETDFQFWFDFIRKINTVANIELTILSNGESALLKIPE